MPRALPLLAAVAMLALAAPAAARDRCAPHRHERVADRDARHVALVKAAGFDQILYVCARRTGRRTAFFHAHGGESIASAQLGGRHVAWEERYDDRYGDPKAGIVVKTIATRRAASPGPALGAPSAWSMAADGQIAALSDRGAVLWAPGVGTRILDSGRDVGAPRFAGATVAWTHGGAPRSAPRAIARGACPAGSFGTAEVEVSLAGPSWACWRATGRTTSISAGYVVDADIAGRFVALTAGFDVARFDASDGTALTFPRATAKEHATPRSVRVTPDGALAWAEERDAPSPSGIYDVWAVDGGGRRIVGTNGGQPLIRDGAQIWWSVTGSLTLTGSPPTAP